MIQLHKILIGLVLVGFFAVTITTFISGGAIQYAKNSENMTYNESFNKLTELSNQMSEFQAQENETVTDSSISDVVGSFFSNMYQSAKVLRGSVEVVGDMTDAIPKTLPAGSDQTQMSVLKTVINLSFIIVIFVGIFLAFVTGSERT